jgi:hypothetical protein
VAKDSKDAFDELMLFAIDFQVLVIRNFTSACAIVSLSLPMLHNPYCSVFVCGAPAHDARQGNR